MAEFFATLASVAQGYGNLMLTPDQQASFVQELREVFVPIAGGWGRMGMTHIRLAAANKDELAGGLSFFSIVLHPPERPVCLRLNQRSQ